MPKPKSPAPLTPIQTNNPEDLSPREKVELCIAVSQPTFEAAMLFITKFCRTVDAVGNIAPLPDLPHVREFVLALHSGGDLHVEKSRQMMATWIACAYVLWELQFRSGYIGFLTSRKEKLVDDGGENSSPNSLLGRIRWIHERLPVFIKREVKFTFLKATCAATGSYLIGESANVNMGRGGTYTRAICDEWSQVPQSEGCFASLRSACVRGIVLLSTPYGPTGCFARIKKEKSDRFQFITLHWSKHPEKGRGAKIVEGKWTSPWYEYEKKSMTPDTVARELDISYSKSIEGLVYGMFDFNVHVKRLTYDPHARIVVGVDFGILAPTAAVIGMALPNELQWLRDYQKAGLIARDNALNVIDIIRSMGYKGPLSEVWCYGDPAGNAREQKTGSSVIDDWRLAGLTTFRTRATRILDGIRAVRALLATERMYIDDSCTTLIENFGGYRGQTGRGGLGGNPDTDTPEHGEQSHMMDAVRYPTVHLFPARPSAANAVGTSTPTPSPFFGYEERPMAMSDVRDVRAMGTKMKEM